MSNSNKKRCFDDVDKPDEAAPLFAMTPRKNEFSERTWWMVDMDSSESNQGATALVKRCMRNYDWGLDQTKKILKGYRQFLTLKKELKDWNATLLSPSHLVDQMWHQHILDISNYYHDMVLLCGGQIVLHNPDGALDHDAKKSRDERTRGELMKKFGSENVDRVVWGIPSNRSPLNSDTRGEIPGAGLITIRIKDQAGEETFFKISMMMKMRKVFQTYANRKGMPVASLRFLLDGNPIKPDLTPTVLEMEDMDQVDCVLDECGC